VAGLPLIGTVSGQTALWDLLARLVKWWVGTRWYAVAPGVTQRVYTDSIRSAGMDNLPGRTIGQSLAPEKALSRVHILELDGIRGIAVVSVLAYHLIAYSMQLRAQLGQVWTTFPKLIELLTWPGFLGVDVFFVLSGFLITGILLDSKNDEHFLRNFYVRRALRILPLYMVVLTVIGVAYSNSGRFVLLSVFFLSNLTVVLGIPAFGPMWSLAIEEHFYLIWPWVVKGVSRRNLIAVAWWICAIEPIVRLAGFPLWQGDSYFYSWTRFDGLAWGALIACFVRSPSATGTLASKLSWACLAAAAIVLLAGIPFGILSRQNPVGAAFQYAPAQFVSMSMILAAVGVPGHMVTSLLRSRVLRLFGDLSYCLYLIHMNLMDAYDALAARYFPASEMTLGPFGALLVRSMAVLISAVGLALLSRRFIELPALRLKRLITDSPRPSRSRHPA